MRSHVQQAYNFVIRTQIPLVATVGPLATSGTKFQLPSSELT